MEIRAWNCFVWAYIALGRTAGQDVHLVNGSILPVHNGRGATKPEQNGGFQAHHLLLHSNNTSSRHPLKCLYPPLKLRKTKSTTTLTTKQNQQTNRGRQARASQRCPIKTSEGSIVSTVLSSPLILLADVIFIVFVCWWEG